MWGQRARKLIPREQRLALRPERGGTTRHAQLLPKCPTAAGLDEVRRLDPPSQGPHRHRPALSASVQLVFDRQLYVDEATGHRLREVQLLALCLGAARFLVLDLLLALLDLG